MFYLLCVVASVFLELKNKDYSYCSRILKCHSVGYLLKNTIVQVNMDLKAMDVKSHQSVIPQKSMLKYLRKHIL